MLGCHDTVLHSFEKSLPECRSNILKPVTGETAVESTVIYITEDSTLCPCKTVASVKNTCAYVNCLFYITTSRL